MTATKKTQTNEKKKKSTGKKAEVSKEPEKKINPNKIEKLKRQEERKKQEELSKPKDTPQKKKNTTNNKNKSNSSKNTKKTSTKKTEKVIKEEIKETIIEEPKEKVVVDNIIESRKKEEYSDDMYVDTVYLDLEDAFEDNNDIDLEEIEDAPEDDLLFKRDLPEIKYEDLWGNDVTTPIAIIKEEKPHKSKKIKIKWGNLILLVIIFLSLLGVLYSSYNIVLWKLDNNKTKEKINEVQEEIEVTEVEENENTEIIEQKEEIPKFNPYWDYIKMKLIDVDFTDLKKKNPDTAGWVQVGGTNINYPFVQTTDNNFYLKHSFDKSYNQSGWAFMDYRNNKNDYGRHTIIYGHALRSGAIFGTLKNILNEKWQKNTNNHIIKISTEHENTLWQVFSIYTIPDTNDYLKVTFSSDQDFKIFTDMLMNRSIYNFDTTVSESDKIITLSSCYINSNTKMALHAKLIKREAK